MNWKLDFSPETSAAPDISDFAIAQKNMREDTESIKVHLHMMADALKD